MNNQTFNVWTKQEFANLNFGDARLNKRFQVTAGLLASQPLDPINKACGSWADAKAAYRLFENPKVTRREVLKVHQEETVKRMQKHPIVLTIQDTTSIDYSAHIKTLGLGHISTTSDKKTHLQGFFVHTTYAVSANGEPLGIADQKIWVRDKIPVKNKNQRNLPIEEKESNRWLQSMQTVNSLGIDKSLIIHVADREADIFEFLYEAEKLNSSYVVRAAQDRKLIGEEKDDNEECDKLWSRLKSAPTRHTLTIDVPKRGPKEGKRIANIIISFEKITIQRPKKGRFVHESECPSSLSLFAVYIREKNPPPATTPLEWMLLTNIPVMNKKDSIKILNWYKQRWNIEVFHKVLKSGCKVEDCRLQTAEKLEKALILYSIIAWKIHAMTHISRLDPDAPASIILADHEWKALCCNRNKTNVPPDKPPSIRDAVRWIAALGGFLGRKGDKEPGTITIWRGWQRLTDISESWLLFSAQKTYG